MAFVIAEPCIGTKDTACVDACPVDCIHPKKNTTYDDVRPGFDEVPQLYIDPIECIDCGACVPVCPVSAIFALDDLPGLRSRSSPRALMLQHFNCSARELATINSWLASVVSSPPSWRVRAFIWNLRLSRPRW